MRNYEDQAERRLRKVNDIKAMFWKRLAEEDKKPQEERLGRMAIYEEVAYPFYMSPTHPDSESIKYGFTIALMGA